MKKEILFQDCPWYIKIWRYRWYLLIPIEAISVYLTSWSNAESGEIDLDKPWNTWAHSWDIAIGLAQCKMKWFYSWAELEERIDKLQKK